MNTLSNEELNHVAGSCASTSLEQYLALELLALRKEREAAVPVAYMYRDKLHTDARLSLDSRFGNWSPEDIAEYEVTETKLYTAPPAQPVAVPECFQRLLHHADGMTMGHDWNKGAMAGHHREKLCQAVKDCLAAAPGKEG